MSERASRFPIAKRGAATSHAGVAEASGDVKVSPLAWLATLTQRVLSALVLIPIVIALVWFGGWVAFAGALLTLAVAMWELRQMFAHKGWHPPVVLSALAGAGFLLLAELWHQGVAPVQLALVAGASISALIIVTAAWLMLTRRHIEGSVRDWALALTSAFYVGWPLAFFLLLRGNQVGPHNAGFGWLLALFFMVWADDTFALLAGHYFGRHKLAPHISPAKTWEGFAGGMLFTVVAALVFTVLVPAVFAVPLHVPWQHAIVLGVLVAIAGTVGDLAESLLKRDTGVKDSGTIVPGHGGILDRVDSLLFAVLVVFFYAAVLQGIPV